LTQTLIAEQLTKVIGPRTIVDSVSFDVRPGELFGFLGPNGAGKTTTIRMLVGLIRPTSGSVRICGYDVQKQFEQAMRCIGCIVETPDLYKFMTGRENLEHFARMIGPVDKSAIERLAALVSLEHRLDDRVGTYSLGMRQRLGIAQALLGRPRLLILDEPANGLDPAGIREIRQLLRRLAAEEGLSVFISSHLLAEIELMCDRVAIIHRGKILTSGTVSELLRSANEMELKVDRPAEALALARSLGVNGNATDGVITLAIGESEAPRILSALVSQGFEISYAQKRVHTLEEKFLEATGGESVGN